MQEKRNIRLLISLVALLVVTTVVYWLGKEPSTIEIDKGLFRVTDFKTIDEITFQSAKGEKTDLKYNGSRWRLNDQYDADARLIDVLFATLQQAEPKREVAATLKDSIANELRKNGVRISLVRTGAVLKSFLVGGNASKSQSYFMGDDGTPYIVIIPGYRVYIAGIAEMDQSGWRDKRAFDISWRNFKEFTAKFPSHPKQSYRAAYFNKLFGIEGLSESDTIKINAFMDGMMRLTVDNYLKPGSSARYDSLLKTVPAMVIEVKDIGDRVYPLVIFNPLKKDPNVLALIGNKEPVLFQHDKIAPLVRGRDYFVKKP